MRPSFPAHSASLPRAARHVLSFNEEAAKTGAYPWEAKVINPGHPDHGMLLTFPSRQAALLYISTQ